MAANLRFLLINPTALQWRVPRDGVASPATRFFRFSMLSSLYVAAAILSACGSGPSEPPTSPPAPPLAPGTLDPAFGTDGKVITSFGADAFGRSAAVAPDGKIVVGGFINDSPHSPIALARYRENGSLDPSFGAAGLVVAPIGGSDFHVHAMRVQPDGKIVVAGGTPANPPGESRCGIVRFNADGKLDAGFGDGGVVFVDGSDVCYAVAIQPDGRIVAVNGNVLAYRLNPDGSRDTSFGANGVATVALSPPPADGGPAWISGQSRSLTVQPDGKPLVALSTTYWPPYSPAGFHANIAVVGGGALARFGSDGTPDLTFGQAGIAYLWQGSGLYPENADAVALLRDGAFLVAGQRIARFFPTGAIDPAFDPNREFRASAIAVQQNGKVVALSISGLRTQRLLPSGALDTTYGDGGTVDTVIGADLRHLASSITLQPDGRIVVAGSVGKDIVDGGAVIGTRHDFAVVRYIGDPASP